MPEGTVARAALSKYPPTRSLRTMSRSLLSPHRVCSMLSEGVHSDEELAMIQLSFQSVIVQGVGWHLAEHRTDLVSASKNRMELSFSRCPMKLEVLEKRQEYPWWKRKSATSETLGYRGVY